MLKGLVITIKQRHDLARHVHRILIHHDNSREKTPQTELGREIAIAALAYNP